MKRKKAKQLFALNSGVQVQSNATKMISTPPTVAGGRTDDDSLEYYLSINPIELLGYAKNNIIEAQERAGILPDEYIGKLAQAYRFIHEIQEFLYNK